MLLQNGIQKAEMDDIPTAINNKSGPGMPSNIASSSSGHFLLSDTPSSNFSGQIVEIDAQIALLDTKLASLQPLIDQRLVLISKRAALQKQIDDSIDTVEAPEPCENAGIDYFGRYTWSDELKIALQSTFKISNFRLTQEGVCNANMDGRDIVCIMPTGGGKSLTYQLPAICQPGLTLVVCPLISLMADQILYLREKNIQAEMLSEATPLAMKQEIMQRVFALATGRQNSKPELKLIFATPERVVRSQHFFAVLTKLARSGKLARIVIDEAHCVSQLGHDFRPDYKELSKLRVHFPDVPIIALSATCPPVVLADIMSILCLKPVTPAQNATTNGTVYFASPLYRRNLRYKVFEKASQPQTVARDITEYILTNHLNKSGIVYCTRRKDAEVIARSINQISGGVLSTGAYHAQIDDARKKELHERWHRGEIKIVCATNAFGLGINKLDVRFVIHHSMSKSIENYYQESGRAGRDNKNADCLIFYRAQDANIYCKENDSANLERVEQMMYLCQDPYTCRNFALTKYFAETVEKTTWAGSSEQCGHCDNCTRDAATLDNRSIMDDAKRVVQIVKTAQEKGVRITFADLIRTLRGVGAKERDYFLTQRGGRSDISSRDAEALIVRLLLEKWICQRIEPNSYGVNTYIFLGRLAPPLRRLELPSTDSGVEDHLKHIFLRSVTKKSEKSPRGKRKVRILDDQDIDQSYSKVEPIETDFNDSKTHVQSVYSLRPRWKLRPWAGPSIPSASLLRSQIKLESTTQETNSKSSDIADEAKAVANISWPKSGVAFRANRAYVALPKRRKL